MSGISENDIERIAPPSGLQQSMLFRSLAEPNSGHYIEQLSYEFSNFDLEAMQAALDAVIASRSAMRTSFLWREQATPRQLIFRTVTHPIEVTEFKADDSGQLSADEKQKAVAADRERGLTLNQAPLMRMTVFLPAGIAGSTNATAFCIWTFYHAVVDGWSIALLQHELLKYYAAYRSGDTPILPASDAAPAVSHNSPQENRRLWDQQLAKANRDSALACLPRPSKHVRSYAEAEYCCNSELGTGLSKACQTQRVTFANLVHGAWSLLLCHLNGRSNICYGTIDSGRSELKDGESAVGMFMQLLPVCIEIDESVPVHQFLQDNQRKQWSLQTDRLPSPADIALALQRSPGDELFDSLLLVQNYPAAVFPDNIGLLENNGFEQADAPLVMSIGNTDTVRMLARFQTDRIDNKQAAALQSHLACMLEVFANATEAMTLGEVLDEFSNRSIATSSNTSPFETEEERCIDRFREMLVKHPDKVALIDASQSITYASLASRAEHIREQLVQAGVTGNSTVAVMLPRSVYAVASALAILAQGASYMPIDPGFPLATVESMLTDSGALFVLSEDSSGLETLHESLQVVLLQDTNIAKQNTLSIVSSTNATMCVMFTSGSTGNPKGIALTHKAVMNRLGWMERNYPFTENEICAARTPVNFVDSVAEIFGPLCAGASCRIISDTELSSLAEFNRVIEQNRVSRISLVPSLLNAVLAELRESSAWSSVQLCVVSGEALSTQLVKDFYTALPDSILLNLYGSTEVAADALFFETSPERTGQQEWAPIGKPIDNINARVCNAFGRILPAGTIGELRLQGLGVADAYINDANLSAEKFAESWFISGDLVFKDEHDVLHFKGRADRQIKVRGQRVEPGAIESTLVMHPDVQQAVVIAAQQNLYCFYTGKPLVNSVLTEFSGQHLPAYSLPSQYQHIDKIPLTHNGKIDHEHLHRLTVQTPAEHTADPPETRLSLHQKELGLTIRNIWSELLPDSTITTDTDFFDAGGHSLLAMQMIAGVERALGFSVPLAVFMSNTRLADFAKVLFEGIPKLSAPELITLRDSKAAAPALFCVQGDAYNIVPHCQVDRKIHWISQWSICVDLTRDPLPVPIESVQQTAERYASHIERVYPKGELLIIAACGAAVISIEVARLLQSNGRTPDKLVLMDLPRGELTTASERGFKHRQGRNIFHSAYGYAMRVGGGNKIKAYLDRSKINRKIQRGIALTDVEAAELMHIRLSEALADYEPRQYLGNVELILSKAWYRGVENSEDAKVPEFWRPFLPNVSAIHFSPADHHSDLLQGDAAAFAVKVIER